MVEMISPALNRQAETMAGVPLSDETKRRVDVLFSGDDSELVSDFLVNECGSNLPFCEGHNPTQMERLRFAALKVSEGRLDLLQQAVVLAKQDWRDLLMAAGFGHDVEAHKQWMPWKPGQG